MSHFDDCRGAKRGTNKEDLHGYVTSAWELLSF